MAQQLFYTFEPLSEKKRYRRYRYEELARMTTMQLIDICEREDIIHAAANRLDAAAVDWLVPHQANLRIIDAMRKRLALPREKVVITIDRHANTSAASVPLALAEASADGRIRPGQLVLMEAMGGGLTWGAALARW